MSDARNAGQPLPVFKVLYRNTNRIQERGGRKEEVLQPVKPSAIPKDCVGEAIILAANQLVLRDMGRTPREEVPGKPVGSVHGDSIGVHAGDSANAWRNMARVSKPRNCFASLILGAYQAALDRTSRGGDFLNWQPRPGRPSAGVIWWRSRGSRPASMGGPPPAWPKRAHC